MDKSIKVVKSAQPVVRVKLTLAYDGSGFHGWQLQPDAPTVQGCIEKALERICSRPVRIHGSGRTDAGVHALGQVAHFDQPENKASVPWQKALNAILPDSIRVTRSLILGPDFHARFSAVSKTYCYNLWLEPDYVFPQRRNFVWKTGPLDLESMKKGSDLLVGKHDFRAFMNSGTEVRSTQRKVTGISFIQGLYPQELAVRITADGFLKQMARNIIGALVSVGRHKNHWTKLSRFLSDKTRPLTPATAPARGLCLEKVEYPEKYRAH